MAKAAIASASATALVLLALLLAACGGSATTATTSAATSPKAPASTSAPAQPKAAPSATPVIQGGAIIPPAGYTAILHTGQTAGMPAAAQPAGVSETWTLTSVHYISYAQSQEGRADSVDVAQQIGANEPLPSDQFAVLGITVRNAGTEPDASPVISGGTFYWVTLAGKTGQTALYGVGVPPPDTSAGVLAPYVTNAEPAHINSLNPGQSITGFVVAEVPDQPSAILAESSDAEPAMLIDPQHLTTADICLDTAKTC